jgi:hypothetical protein
MSQKELRYLEEYLVYLNKEALDGSKANVWAHRSFIKSDQ